MKQAMENLYLMNLQIKLAKNGFRKMKNGIMLQNMYETLQTSFEEK